MFRRLVRQAWARISQMEAPGGGVGPGEAAVGVIGVGVGPAGGDGRLNSNASIT